MIPHKPVIEAQQLGERFYLVEKPRLDIAVIGGIDETMEGHEHSANDEIG